MSLDEAIEVLNEHRHREIGTWAINEHREVCDKDDDLLLTYFTPFEAIAIAVFLKTVVVVK